MGKSDTWNIGFYIKGSYFFLLYRQSPTGVGSVRNVTLTGLEHIYCLFFFCMPTTLFLIWGEKTPQDQLKPFSPTDLSITSKRRVLATWMDDHGHTSTCQKIIECRFFEPTKRCHRQQGEFQKKGSRQKNTEITTGCFVSRGFFFVTLFFSQSWHAQEGKKKGGIE